MTTFVVPRVPEDFPCRSRTYAARELSHLANVEGRGGRLGLGRVRVELQPALCPESTPQEG